jgi:hypothetical protein
VKMSNSYRCGRRSQIRGECEKLDAVRKTVLTADVVRSQVPFRDERN